MSNGIKFPRVHIATSVVNRLLNVADGLSEPGPVDTPPPVGAPSPRATRTTGAVLDAQLLTLPGGANMPGIGAAPEVAVGKPLLRSMIER